MILPKEIKDLIVQAQKNAIDCPKTAIEQVQAVIDGKLILGIYETMTVNEIQSGLDEEINKDVHNVSDKIMSLIEANASMLWCIHNSYDMTIDIDDENFCDCFKGKDVNVFTAIIFRKENRHFFDAFNEICRLGEDNPKSVLLHIAAQKIRGIKVVDNLN